MGKAKDLHNISLDSKLENNLILASYNSGAARVKSAFLKEKENWFNQKDLVEAKNTLEKLIAIVTALNTKREHYEN